MGMWRMATFIRHNSGERNNTVGRRWVRLNKVDKIELIISQFSKIVFIILLC
jgi:hypothetical protein